MLDAPTCGERPASGAIKQITGDFVVDELVDFAFSGSGEHALLQIRKRNLSTFDVVDRIHRVIGTPKRDIGFCGLKDKQAITTQWFSVRCTRRYRQAWSVLEDERMEIIAATRHARKLRRGSHSGNRFQIRIRQLEGNLALLQRRLLQIKVDGVPNYFGPQRFGQRNLEKVSALFSGELSTPPPAERSLLLSSARSRMFNDVLSCRVRDGSWNTLQPGDVAMLDKTNSYFRVDAVSAELLARLQRFDIHPSGPLFGNGENPAARGIFALEAEVLLRYQQWCAGLRQFGLRFQRRALRMGVAQMRWEFSDDGILDLYFVLHKGSFATSVLNDFLATKQD